MVWYLLLAHFIADFPFQSDWMVKEKMRLPVLALHVSVHFLVTFVIVGTSRWILWPFILTLALVHFEIDLFKNVVTLLRPKWVIFPYLIDQAIHYASIVLISLWISNRVGTIPLPIESSRVIHMLGLLLVTYVWFISERIFAYKDATYRKEVTDQIWSRMLVRTGIVSVFLMGWNSANVVVASGMTLNFPYMRGKYGWRAFITDVVVSMVVFLFIQLAIAYG